MHPNIHKEDGLIEGRISMVVQSGSHRRRIPGRSHEQQRRGHRQGLLSIGNKMDIDECDVLEYLLEATRRTPSPMPGIDCAGRKFLELADWAKKPIVLLKGGKSTCGRQSVSHTSGDLAGNAGLAGSLLSLAGVTIAQDFQQMMEIARALAMLIKQTPPRCRTAIRRPSAAARFCPATLSSNRELQVAQTFPRQQKGTGFGISRLAARLNPWTCFPPLPPEARPPARRF